MRYALDVASMTVTQHTQAIYEKEKNGMNRSVRRNNHYPNDYVQKRFDSEKDELWMKKKQGKTCPIHATGRVSGYLGSHQQ